MKPPSKAVKLLKAHLDEVLDGSSVSCGLDNVISGIPYKFWGKRVKGLPYTLYELLEHIRLSNRDILEYLTDPHYQAHPWPEAYWPKTEKPSNAKALKKSLDTLHADLKAIRQLLQRQPPLDPLPHIKEKHTLAREIIILSNHLTYHLGQMVLLQRLLGIWK